MKWLIATILGTLLVLAVSFLPAQDETTPREKALPGTSDAKAAPIAGSADNDPGSSAPKALEGSTDAVPDKTTDAPGAGRAAPGSSPSQKSQTTGDDEPNTFRIYRLQHSNAASVADVLRKLASRDVEVNDIVVDERTNSLIFRNGLEKELAAVLQELDVPAPANARTKRSGPPSGMGMPNMMHGGGGSAAMQAPWGRGPGTGHGGPRSGGMATRGGKVSTNSRIQGMFETLSGAMHPGSQKEAQDYDQSEAACLELAKAYQLQQQVTPNDKVKLDQLRSDLSGAVHTAFYERQNRQRAQATELRERLTQIERRISQRGQLANEIIARRVDELLQPEKQWQAGEESSAVPERPVGAGAQYNGFPSEKNNPVASDHGGQPPQNKDASLGWTTDYYDTLVTAREGKQPLLLYFHADNSLPDRVLERRFLKNGEVRAYLESHFQPVSVHVHTAEGKELLDRYDVRMTPTLVFIDPTGETLKRIEGLPNGTAGAFVAELQRIAEPKREEPADPKTTGPLPVRLSPEPVSDPRQRVLDAESGILKAQTEITQAKTAVARSEQLEKLMQQAYRTGGAPQKEMLAATAELEKDEAVLRRAVNELQTAERQLQLAREFLDGQIKLAELELQQAKSRLDVATKDEARSLELSKKNVISRSEVDTSVAAREQAQIQVKRAATILELYQKPLPGRGSPPGGKTGTEPDPAAGKQPTSGSTEKPGKAPQPQSSQKE
jgi:hypothetical protein